ncbi:hypothetical protein HHI36_017167 [Cryptolaemus montrouzieri]|uniref:Uncharacterized protein n=1 Tax=Cryptolaemus montrouzieri TaxID=559131 RepID=A0ABD2NLP2_9CUCU
MDFVLDENETADTEIPRENSLMLKRKSISYHKRKFRLDKGRAGISSIMAKEYSSVVGSYDSGTSDKYIIEEVNDLVRDLSSTKEGSEFLALWLKTNTMKCVKTNYS